MRLRAVERAMPSVAVCDQIVMFVWFHGVKSDILGDFVAVLWLCYAAASWSATALFYSVTLCLPPVAVFLKTHRHKGCDAACNARDTGLL